MLKIQPSRSLLNKGAEVVPPAQAEVGPRPPGVSPRCQTQHLAPAGPTYLLFQINQKEKSAPDEPVRFSEDRRLLVGERELGDFMTGKIHFPRCARCRTLGALHFAFPVWPWGRKTLDAWGGGFPQDCVLLRRRTDS